jgi:hypothetical protein
MQTGSKNINTPTNEFQKRKQELYTMKLCMPIEYKEEWLGFKKSCTKLGVEFEDVLGDLFAQFNRGDISYQGN